MKVGLVPYQFHVEIQKSNIGADEVNLEYWRLPDNVISSIDLRSIEQISNINSIGYAIATLADDNIPEGFIELETGNITNDRDAWFSIFGFRPEGVNVTDWIFSHLTDGADDNFELSCRPLRIDNRQTLDIYLDGKKQRNLSNYEMLKQAVLARRDLDKILDDVESNKLPPDIHRKVLKAEADRLGIDWRTLRSKSKRWKNESPLEPTTEVTDTFTVADRYLNGYNGWGSWTNSASPFYISGNKLVFFDSNGGAYANNVIYNGTTFSSSDNLAELIDLTRGEQNPVGIVCRGNASTTYYLSSAYQTNNRLYSFVSNAGTQLTTYGSLPATLQLRIKAVGSTISYGHVANTWQTSVTNTAITVGLRVGVYSYPTNGGSSFDRTAETFYARDYLSPTISNISPSTGSTTGGTAITITGTNFESTSTVTIGGASATSVTFVSSTSITCNTPAGTLGAKDVVVTNPDSGLSATSSGGFTYAASGPPTILNPTTINGTLGSLFTTTVSGSNTPTSYSGVNLPRWLSINSSTGLISGTVPFGAVKTYNSILYATNANGTSGQNTTLNFIKPSANSGFITKAKSSEPYKQGSRVTFLGLRFTKTSGLPSVDNPNMTNRLDQSKYYGR